MLFSLGFSSTISSCAISLMVASSMPFPPCGIPLQFSPALSSRGHFFQVIHFHLFHAISSHAIPFIIPSALFSRDLFFYALFLSCNSTTTFFLAISCAHLPCHFLSYHSLYNFLSHAISSGAFLPCLLLSVRFPSQFPSSLFLVANVSPLLPFFSCTIFIGNNSSYDLLPTLFTRSFSLSFPLPFCSYFSHYYITLLFTIPATMLLHLFYFSFFSATVPLLDYVHQS